MSDKGYDETLGYPMDTTWFPIAFGLTVRGHSVIVTCPDAEAFDYVYDGVEDHGDITVVPCDGTGWTITIHEPAIRAPSIEAKIIFDPEPGDT